MCQPDTRGDLIGEKVIVVMGDLVGWRMVMKSRHVSGYYS